MKNALISGLIVSAVVAAAPAFADDAAPYSAPQTQSVAQAAPYGAKTRAEVRAELAEARRNGDLEPVNELTYPQLLPYQARHAELAASRATLSRVAANGAETAD
ncbi:hypothetical protein BGLT_04045 [Caballeronia glathei]|jgi:hypothetical protein|uniref:DUF4148 domain-containing protein n=1 Tax=Caballeronia glathei TaxID=60547 RepID=A0A069PUE1_9BURK|nr:DUF4148 domain-containing protein [Caballeronia glathei]KDR44062.1 hypothetical protein BG61_25365 [Caballeronia glathei]CDY75104.1 hypothetical protein BGLT_04045 [Caballeronia glathei]